MLHSPTTPSDPDLEADLIPLTDPLGGPRQPAGRGLATRIVWVAVAIGCLTAAMALYLFAPDFGDQKPEKNLTEEWTETPVKPAEKPAEPGSEKSGPLRLEIDSMPGGSGTQGRLQSEIERKTVVRLSNLRRVLGKGETDNLEVNYEVLRDGIMILKDAATVKMSDSTVGYVVSAPGKEGTLTIPAAIPAKYVGPIEVSLVLRRKDEDLISNTVVLK